MRSRSTGSRCVRGGVNCPEQDARSYGADGQGEAETLILFSNSE